MYDIKNFILGLGVGLVLMSLLFYSLISINAQKLLRENNATISDDDVINRAKSLGMIFVSDLPKGEKQISDDDILQRAMELGMVFKDQLDDIELQTFSYSDSDVEYVLVNISHGINAKDIATILYQRGVIDNVSSYVEYLINRKVTTELLTGTFNFPLNSDFDTITQIMLH